MTNEAKGNGPAMTDDYSYLADQASRRGAPVRQVTRWLARPGLDGGKPRTIGLLLADVAGDILDLIADDTPELTAGLRKLLEARDCLTRAATATEAGE